MAKLLDIVPGEGGRTKYSIVATAVINVAIVAWEVLGWAPLPDGVWSGINMAAGLVMAMFLADKNERIEAQNNEIIANQPAEAPVVVVTTSDPATKVAASGAEVVR